MANGRTLVAGAALLALAAGWIGRGLVEHRTAAPAASVTTSSAAAAPIASAAPVSSEQMQQVFGDIYRTGKWATNADDAGSSGLGSTLESTVVYRAFLQKFMKDADVHSVVDAGCGDWEFSSAMDWTGIDYQGFDIVPAVIDADTKKFAKPNVRFFVRDIVTGDLPPADLLIVKHVLQHLPTAAVQRVLAKIPNYKHVILVDSVDRVTLSADNEDIQVGSFRWIDPTRPPYGVRGAKLLTYWDGADMQQVVYVAGHR
jgi:SAM-dependent methyltransferase